MKIYILRSRTTVYVVNEVMETKDFFLVPLASSAGFDVYAKDVFTLTVEEASPAGRVGF